MTSSQPQCLLPTRIMVGPLCLSGCVQRVLVNLEFCAVCFWQHRVALVFRLSGYVKSFWLQGSSFAETLALWLILWFLSGTTVFLPHSEEVEDAEHWLGSLFSHGAQGRMFLGRGGRIPAL